MFLLSGSGQSCTLRWPKVLECSELTKKCLKFFKTSKDSKVLLTVSPQNHQTYWKINTAFTCIWFLGSSPKTCLRWGLDLHAKVDQKRSMMEFCTQLWIWGTSKINVRVLYVKGNRWEILWVSFLHPGVVLWKSDIMFDIIAFSGKSCTASFCRFLAVKRRRWERPLFLMEQQERDVWQQETYIVQITSLQHNFTQESKFFCWDPRRLWMPRNGRSRTEVWRILQVLWVKFALDTLQGTNISPQK